MARTVTLTELNVQAVEAAYAKYYAVATADNSSHTAYELERQALRRVIRANVKGFLTARLPELEEHLSDNVGFANVLPGILRHMGYDVDDSQNVYARTYAEAREDLERMFPKAGGFDASRGSANYVLGRLEMIIGQTHADLTRQHYGHRDHLTARAEAAAWLKASQDHADHCRDHATYFVSR